MNSSGHQGLLLKRVFWHVVTVAMYEVGHTRLSLYVRVVQEAIYTSKNVLGLFSKCQMWLDVNAVMTWM